MRNFLFAAVVERKSPLKLILKGGINSNGSMGDNPRTALLMSAEVQE